MSDLIHDLTAHHTSAVFHDSKVLVDDKSGLSSRRERKPLRRMMSLVSWTFVLASVLALVVFGLGPQTGTYRTLTVLSGSMRPAFAPGDVVIATKKSPKDVKVGDVIVFNQPEGDHHVTTHRVVKIYQHGDLPLVQTKGDANNGPDSFKLQIQGNELWYVRAHVPKFGYVIHALRRPLIQFLAFGCLGLLALTFLWQIWSGGDDRREGEKRPGKR